MAGTRKRPSVFEVGVLKVCDDRNFYGWDAKNINCFYGRSAESVQLSQLLWRDGGAAVEGASPSTYT